MRGSPLLLVALVSVALAGCLAAPSPTVQPAAAPGSQVWPAASSFAQEGDWSRPLAAGTLGILPVELARVPAAGGTELALGIWRPDVPEGTRVPVLLDAGPYFGNGEGTVDRPTGDRLSAFLIENFVPHGYAVVLAPVRGTGDSDGCNDYMGPGEQADLDALVTWLGQQEWSNGNVGMIGKSYDGGTTFQAAQYGNPHLKTIVPISGVPGLRQLHFVNGTAEGRTAGLWFLYWTFGLTTEGRAQERMAQSLCAHVAEGLLAGPSGQLTGDPHAPGTGFWEARDFVPRILENYRGSMYLVHGLQDWNVHPDIVFPFYGQFPGPKKALLGQWAHDYPDRPQFNANATRWDWAEALLRWFDRELKGLDVDTGPAVDVQDDTGAWRTEATWPPEDARLLVLRLGEGTLGPEEGAPGEALVHNPGAVLDRGPLAGLPARGLAEVWFAGEPLAAPLRLAGMPQLPLTVVPLGAAGHVAAELWEASDEERRIIGRGYMDLRFADGSDRAQAVVPGQPLELAMQLMPLDSVVAEGHWLELRVTTDRGAGGMAPGPLSAPWVLRYGGSTTGELRLPVIERGPAAFAGAWGLGPAGEAPQAGIARP